jgi:glycosyltransferase involved in cell wall biosynthesis
MLLESFYPVVGGMETQARNLAAGLAASGVELLFVTRRSSRDLARTETVDGAPVYRVPPVMRSSRARWLMVLTAIPALVRLRRTYDVILVPGFRALGITAVIMGKLLGKRSVLKAESCGEMSGDFFTGGLASLHLEKSSWPVKWGIGLRNRLLAKADALVSLSSEMTEEYLGAGVPPDRLHVIAQSADTERFRPASPAEKAELRRKLGLPERGVFAIFTGRIVSYKGIPHLVRAWERLTAAHPEARLLIVGAGGVDIFNWEAELKDFVETHGLAGSVVLTGAVRNVEEYLRASDIYAFPTENEAFPLAMLEAMACGLAVIGTSIGGLKDVLADGRNGLVMAPGDAEQLYARLDRLLRDAALRDTLGQAARATVVENYTREIVTQKYIALFQACLAGDASAARPAS